MGFAFVTRNPYLPEDYFKNAVDDFVVDLNSRIDPPEQSLLNCKKRLHGARGYVHWADCH